MMETKDKLRALSKKKPLKTIRRKSWKKIYKKLENTRRKA